MRSSELEEIIDKTRKTITKNRILEKAIYLAENFGKMLYDYRKDHKSLNSCDASFNYLFESNGLKIDYESYYFGDQRLEIHSKDNKVFEAKDIINNPPVVQLKVRATGEYQREFTILKFYAGDWIKNLTSLYDELKRKKSETDAWEKKRKAMAEAEERRDPTIPAYKEMDALERFRN